MPVKRLFLAYVEAKQFQQVLDYDRFPALQGTDGQRTAARRVVLILSNIHSPKGREWSAVSILNVVEGSRTSDLATGSELDIQEEHWPLCVAMSRAKNHLERMVARCFNTTGQSSIGDGLVYASRTRFIPNQLLPWFEGRTWTLAINNIDKLKPGPFSPIDLAARMRAMWP